LARRTRVEAGALAGERFVTTRPGYWQRSLTDQLFAGSGVEPTIACEGDEPYAIRGLISAGAGIGLMPAVARPLGPGPPRPPHPPVAWLRLEAPAPRRPLSLVWRTDAYRSAAARALTSFAISHFGTWRGDA